MSVCVSVCLCVCVCVCVGVWVVCLVQCGPGGVDGSLLATDVADIALPSSVELLEALASRRSFVEAQQEGEGMSQHALT